MQKSTKWLLTALAGGALIWSCSPQQLVTDAIKNAASAAPGTAASAVASAAPGAVASAVASAAPGTVASALPSSLPSGLPSGLPATIPSGLLTGGGVSSGTCAAVLQCVVNAEPSTASAYNPLIAQPNSTQCQLAATGAVVTFPQCKK